MYVCMYVCMKRFMYVCMFVLAVYTLEVTLIVSVLELYGRIAFGGKGGSSCCCARMYVYEPIECVNTGW